MSCLWGGLLVGAVVVRGVAAYVTDDTSVGVSEDGVRTLAVSVPEGSGLATFESTRQ